jgi:hypothetical protein
MALRLDLVDRDVVGESVLLPVAELVHARIARGGLFWAGAAFGRILDDNEKGKNGRGPRGPGLNENMTTPASGAGLGGVCRDHCTVTN